VRLALILLLALQLSVASSASSDWFGSGKLVHFAAEGGITTVGAGMAQGMFHVGRSRAALYGAATAVVVGGVKELYDWKFGESRRFDLRDFGVDIAGAGLGVVSTHLAARGFPRRHPRNLGETLAATGCVMLASTLATSVGVLPWLREEQRQEWYLPVGLIGAGGVALLGASRLSR